MQKIANLLTGRTILPSVSSTLLSYADTTHVSFAAATNALTAAAYAAWQAANPTVRPFTVTQIIGNDPTTPTPALLVEYTVDTTTDPKNSDLSQTLISGPSAVALTDSLQAWKIENSPRKIVRTTQMIGLDGNPSILVEHTISPTSIAPKNSDLSQVFFPDGDTNTSVAQYLTWKNIPANSNLKPYRLTYIIGNDGSTGILVENTNTSVTTPSAGQLILQFIPNDNTTGVVGFANNLQNYKNSNIVSQIFRVTAVYQGFLIESTLNGNTPNNNLVSQSAYSTTTYGATADAYQVFKSANPTLKPIRLTAMTWGDGINTLLAEYIS